MPSKSLYQITKSSIEQGIVELQEKIRRRKQLQLGKDIEDNLMINAEKLYQYEMELGQLHNVYQHAKYDPMLSYAPPMYPMEPLLPYNESLLITDSIKYSAQELNYQQLKERIRKQQATLDYLRKLQRMKQQSLFIQDRLSTINKVSANQSLNYQRMPYPSQNLSKKELFRQNQINEYKKLLNPIRQQPRAHQRKSSKQKMQNRSPINYIKQSSPYQKKSGYENIDPYSVFQYDDEPKSQDSSLLVDKYNRGIRAQQYNRDMERLALIEQKLRMVEQQQQYYKPEIDGKKFGMSSSIPLYPLKQQQNVRINQNKNTFHRSPQKMSKAFETPQQPKASPSTKKQNYEKTKQKNTIPVIKQDLEEGEQTIINTINKNSKVQKVANTKPIVSFQNKPSQFSHQKLQKVINEQKKQTQPIKIVNDYKKSYLNQNKSKNNSSQKKAGSKNKDQATKRLGNTIDVSILDRKLNKSISPMKTIQQPKYLLNPYLAKNQKVKPSKNRSLSERYNKSKRSIINSPYSKNVNYQRDRSTSKQKLKDKSKSGYIVNKSSRSKQKDISALNLQAKQLFNQQKQSSFFKRSRQICIPAPLFPASQQIQYQQSELDHIRKLCNQKIEKRLHISTIVFKDSKLRNVKHQMDHLLSKFENQIKGRKQIRDKINTNPRILRKHKMVVDKITI